MNINEIKQIANKSVPRTWLLWIVAIFMCVLVLPELDHGVMKRFVSFFAVTQVSAWVALKVFWIKRTNETEGDERLLRDFIYGAIAIAGLIATSNVVL